MIDIGNKEKFLRRLEEKDIVKLIADCAIVLMKSGHYDDEFDEWASGENAGIHVGLAILTHPVGNAARHSVGMIHIVLIRSTLAKNIPRQSRNPK